jgi:hypothetical protein
MVAWRRPLVWTVIVCSLVVAAASALPPLVGATLGTRAIERWVEKHYGDQVQVKIDSVELHWSGPQTLRGIHISTPDGLPVLVIREATTQTALSTILWHKLSNQVVHLDQPVIAQIDFARDDATASLDGPIKTLATSVEGEGAQLVLDAPIVIPTQTPMPWQQVQLSGSLQIAPLRLVLEQPIAELLSVSPSVEFRSTPISFRVQDSQLEISRAYWLIGDRHHFAIWGAVGLAESQARLILGIGSHAAASLLQVKNIPYGEMLQVPITLHESGMFVDTELARRHALVYILRSKGLPFLQRLLQARQPPPPPPQTAAIPTPEEAPVTTTTAAVALPTP